MSDPRGRDRKPDSGRRPDHEALDTRPQASLIEPGDLTTEAGLSPQEAVERVRQLVNREERPRRLAAVDWLRGLGPAPVLRFVLPLALVLVLVAVFVAMRPDPAPRVAEAASTAVAEPQSIPAGVGGFAELYVAVYLGLAGEGAEDLLRPYLVGEFSLAGLEPGRLYVQNVITMDVQPANEGWTVDVAAQTLRRVEGGYADPEIVRYRVDVVDRDGWVSPTTPTPIEAGS